MNYYKKHIIAKAMSWLHANPVYSDLPHWAWSGRPERFYADQWWPEWRDDIRPFPGANPFDIKGNPRNV